MLYFINSTDLFLIVLIAVVAGGLVSKMPVGVVVGILALLLLPYELIGNVILIMVAVGILYVVGKAICGVVRGYLSYRRYSLPSSKSKGA